jgi:hypothetical protein
MLLPLGQYIRWQVKETAQRHSSFVINAWQAVVLCSQRNFRYKTRCIQHSINGINPALRIRNSNVPLLTESVTPIANRNADTIAKSNEQQLVLRPGSRIL